MESEPGKGAKFTLRFQCQSAVEATPIPDPSPPPSPIAVRVLLIDDNLAVLEATALSLQGAGYQVSTAASGQEAYDTFLREPCAYDIVVTDMTMPGMKGDELAKLLRETDSEIPILCVSGYHDHSDLLSALSGVSMLSKPYLGNQLIDKIATILAKP